MQTTTDTRFCPECRAEYYAHVSQCPACEVTTVEAHALAPQVDAALGAFGLDPEEMEAGVRATNLQDAKKLAGFLQANGVPVCLAPHGDTQVGCCATTFVVGVRGKDQERALELDRQFMASQMPEGEAVFAEMPEVGNCPACGAGMAEDAPECPDCGLALG